MDETLRAVATFHDAFEIPTPDSPGVPGLDQPGVAAALGDFADRMAAMGKELMQAAADHDKSTPLLRLQLIQEELAELADALHRGDVVDALDALCDLRYVVDGTVLQLGLGPVFLEGFREVQRSNMSKLEDGRPVKDSSGRVVKGRDYRPPNLRRVLEDAVGSHRDASDQERLRS